MSRIADALAKAAGMSIEPGGSTQPADPWQLAETPAEPSLVVVRPRPTEFLPEASVSLEAVATEAAQTSRPRECSLLREMPAPSRSESRSPDRRYFGKLAGDEAWSDDSSEQFHALAAAVRQSAPQGDAGILLVTSALPAEGKTLVSSNVAEILSRSFGLRVLLIDSDFRHPSIHSAYGLPAAPGLAESLEADLSTPVPAYRLSRQLSVVVAGRPPGDPGTLVAGSAMRRLLQQAGPDYDWIVLDSPPMRLATDARLLADLADRVLLVVKAGKTPYDAVQEALSGLASDRVLGVALNEA